MELNEKIQLARKKNGMSQEDLANILNVSRQAVQKWESGASKPEVDKLVQISNVLDVSLDYLLKDTEESNNSNNNTIVSEEKSEKKGVSLAAINGWTIVGMILSPMVVGGSYMNNTYKPEAFFFLFLYLITIPLGCFAMHKMKTATSKKDTIGISVLTLIFVSTIGGILMLCTNDAFFEDNKRGSSVPIKKKEKKPFNKKLFLKISVPIVACGVIVGLGFGIAAIVKKVQWDNEPKYRYEINVLGEAEIVGIQKNDGYLEIPETIEGCPVTKISYLQNIDLKQLIIPTSIREFGSTAFYGCAIDQVVYKGTMQEWCNIKYSTMESSPNRFSKYMMKYMEDGEMVMMDYDFTTPSYLTKITYQFTGCKFTKLTVAQGVTEIAENAFYRCCEIEKAIIPTSVQKIGKACFGRCWALAGLEMPFIGETADNSSSFGYLFGVSNQAYGSFNTDEIPDDIGNVKLTAAKKINSNAFVSFPIDKLFIPNSVVTVGERICLRNSYVKFYCEASSKPSGWDTNWHNSTIPATETHDIYWNSSRASFSI